MMDYYEELGIDRSASPDEIRQAYRQLVRILHPDHCHDDQLRPLAELQMKRLNAILRVLTNPGERESYDRTVVQTLCLPALAGSVPRPPRWFWPAAGGAAVLALVILLTYQPQPVPVRIAPSEAAPPVVSPAPPPRK